MPAYLLYVYVFIEVHFINELVSVYFHKNNVILLVWKHYFALGLG